MNGRNFYVSRPAIGDFDQWYLAWINNSSGNPPSSYYRAVLARLTHRLNTKKVTVQMLADITGLDNEMLTLRSIKQPYERDVTPQDIEWLHLNAEDLNKLNARGISMAYVFAGRPWTVYAATVTTTAIRRRFGQEVWRLKTRKEQIFKALDTQVNNVEELDLFDLCMLHTHDLDVEYIMTGVRTEVAA